jgi:surface antigen/LysM repeat protein
MRNIKKNILRAIPYLACFGAIFALMFFGSQKNYEETTTKPIISAINDTSFVVTADQLSESFIVASVANVVNLPSVLTINENFVSIAMKYEVAGAAGGNGIVSKPNIIDTSNLVRGIASHTVVEGETLATIAAKFNNGVTEQQIRWSNNMKTGAVTVGQRLYVPTVPGILYTVKANDAIEALASKYKSDIDEIVILNDLEETGLVEGKTIILPNGVLPETERPEYVAPVRKPQTGFTYIRDSGVRRGMTQVQSYAYWRNMYSSTRWHNNPGAFGNCTWYAWYWRRVNMGASHWLPSGTIGNAGTWHRTLGGSFVVNKTPAYGAVVQTSTGSPGHVGVVVGMVQGSHIVIEEMNYAGPNGKFNIVYRSTINWADALRFNYIHGRR